MPVPLPEGTRLLHIGPQKTGTTTLQGAFHTNREALAAHGVHYAGPKRQARQAAVAVVEGRVRPGSRDAAMSAWPRLVSEVQSSQASRVVISAEMFANAKPDRIAVIAEALGPTTHVVLTLRPLVRILPSQWQQYVQNRLRTPYDEWLDQILRHPDSTALTPTFWFRHRHDRLAARWAEVVGPQRVTAVVLDESDRTTNLRAFERLLDLPSGILVPTDETNRSFTLSEIELVREFNEQFQLAGWPAGVYETLIRYGMSSYLREGAIEWPEPAITTPPWAQRAADEVAQAITAGLLASGVNVLGDVAHLRLPLRDEGDEANIAQQVDVRIAARAMMGVLKHAVIDPKTVHSDGSPDARPGAAPGTQHRVKRRRWGGTER